MSSVYQQNQDAIVATAAVFTSLSVIFVVVRLLARHFIVRQLGYDDYTIVAALVFMIGYFIEIILTKMNNTAFPMTTLSFTNMIQLLQITLAIEITYYFIIWFVKISILFTYLRFAVSETFTRLCWATIIFHSIFSIVSIVVTSLQCQPIQKMWDLLGIVNGACINGTAFFYTTSGINIITDLWIVALPIKTLQGINRPFHEKIGLFVIFGMGLFATSMSITRLHTIYKYTLATDPFAEAYLINIWSMIEVGSAIMCASLPALKPIISKYKKRNQATTQRSNSGYQRYDPDGLAQPKSDRTNSSSETAVTPLSPTYQMQKLGRNGNGSVAISAKHRSDSTDDILGDESV